MKRFFIKTFGCRLNQYQSEKIAEHLSACNLLQVKNPDKADIVIVNGCVVTHKGERDTRKFINKYAKKGKQVVATGCYIKLPYVRASHNVSFLSFNDIKKVFVPQKELLSHQSRHRVLIGIQEGCNFRCSYCIVPFVRGPSKDRNKEEILREIASYTEQGAREIVITGTEIGGYGREQNTNLAKLVREIKDAFPLLKIRLSSLLPLYVTEEVISLFKEGIVLPHIHLPLQSGSRDVLKDMKRPYKLERFIWAFEKLYQSHPNMAIGTDIIVGYPTETEKDFEMTYKLIDKLPFAYAHVFLYSKRPFTQSFHLKELPYKVIKSREKKLLRLVSIKKKRFLQRFIGQYLYGMIEKKENNILKGTTENYIKFIADGRYNFVPGQYVKIKIIGIEHNYAKGVIENLS